MCDCFHLAFPNWHATSSGTAGRRLRGPEPGTEDDSVCDEPAQFTEGERPRPQGSSPVEEFPEKYTDSDKECEAEQDPRRKSGGGKKTRKSGLGSMFEKRSTSKMSKLKEAHSPESEVIVKTATDGCAEGLVYGGGGAEGIFIKEVVPESPASKNLKLKEGDQILSATVYFDNVPYEDAVQILEHAQSYKVKLCLKRKPDITETEAAAMESDIIPEEELCAPEMREQGKTGKRRGDARISWPKFPSFGKGRKTRFTRSHSSSEADEQRKLELSPTTSDTESPIKSQDALKGKKRHKMKLSLLTKRSRISSSEDTDAPTTGQTSGDIYHTASEMLSPECLESLSGETPQVYVSEELRLEQNNLMEPQSPQHKVELISVDSTLKTADLTVALADQGSSSGLKSPNEKKKKKERSELKIKILGKDKSHKKDAKAKASPKRLKTLGASIEIADQPVNEKSDSHTDVQRDQPPLDVNSQITSSETSKAKLVTTQMEMSLPKVELDISDVKLMRKSHQKGEEHPKKEKDGKQKKETKTCPTFKLPKIGLGDIATEETIQTMSVNVECPTAMEKHKVEGTAALTDDPYDRLSKSGHSRTPLPKREDIEIPGMEDMSLRPKAKGIKEPKAVSTRRYGQVQTEAVQMSIDVDSVKEAVSKLPGFKLPKVDPSGMPIPEEITVIDANAQRISVKTPTKVADARSKHEAHLMKFDLTPADLTSEELLIETKVDYKKPEKAYNTKTKQSEVHKREDIIITGKESVKRDFGFKLPKQNISGQEDRATLGERTILLQDVTTSKTETRQGKGQMGGVVSDVEIPDIDSIEYIDSVGVSPATKKGGGISLSGFGVHLDATKPKADISFPDIRGEGKDVGPEEHTTKLVQFGAVAPKFSVNVPDGDKNINIDGAEINVLQRKAEKSKYKIPNVSDTLGSADFAIQEQKVEVGKPELEMKPLQTEVDLDGEGSRFKMPKFGISMPKVKGPEFDLSFSNKDGDVTLPEAKVGVKLPKAPEVDVTRGSLDICVPEQKLKVDKPEVEIKPLQTEVELEGRGSRFKMPKFGISMPKVKGPEFDLSFSNKDVDLKSPEAEFKLPEAPEVDVKLGKAEVLIPDVKMEVDKHEVEIKPLQTEVELDGQGSRFKMPKFGISMPKVKGPEFDLSFSNKDGEVTLPEAKAEVSLPDVELKEPSAKVEMKAAAEDTSGSPSKFKMPSLSFSKPKVKVPDIDLNLPKKDTEVTSTVKLPEAPQVDVSLGKAEVLIPEGKVEVQKPEVQIKPLHADVQVEGRGSRFKMPKFGIKMPKVKGPEFDLSFSKKDVDIKSPEAEFKLPEAPEVDVKLGKAEVLIPDVKMEVDKPELEMKPSETQVELDGEGSRFKMPKFGISMPKVKGPEFDLSFSNKDGDVTLPEAKVGVNLPKAPEVDVSLGSVDVSVPEQKLKVDKPELEIKPLQTDQVELDGEGSRFKMPKFGISMPKVKGPEFDLSLSKKDVEVTLPEAKAEVKLPDVELKHPSAKVEVKASETEAHVEGSPSRFKFPTFKLPKFGIATPKVTVEAPDMDKDKDTVHIVAQNIDVEGPSFDVKMTAAEGEGKESKFKTPSFGISLPKVQGPKIDLSSSKKDIDNKSPEAEFKLPEAPEVDVKLGKAEVLIPGVKVEVEKPELEMKPSETQVELDGHGSRFKMPKFGISMPKVKGPEFDLSFSNKDGDVTLPEAKAEVSLPDVELKEPSAKVEVKAPEIKAAAKDTSGSPSKFKMPSLSFSKPKVKVPDIDLNLSKKDTEVTSTVKLPEAPQVDVSLGKAEVLIPEGKVEVQKPEVQIKPLHADVQVEGRGSRFKMPKFGIKMPKVKGPEFDLSFSKKDVDIKSPEAEFKLPEAPEVDVKLGKAEVLIPGVKMEVEKPELEMKPSETQVELDGEGSRFKMPKFGISIPKVKGPEFDLSFSNKDGDVTLPEAKVGVNLPNAPEVDVSLGSLDVSVPEQKLKVDKPEFEIKPLQTDQVELDGEGSRFKMPKFGISMPKVKGPEFDLSFSKKDVDIKSPEAEFKLPEAPEVDVKLGKAEVLIPDVKMEVEKPELELKPSETQVELEGHGSRFKMPKFGIKMPKVKGPEFDLSFSNKDGDVTLPEAKAEVSLPDVELKEPSAKVEVKAAAKDTSGSPSKFKMPSLSFSKPKVKVPDIDLNLSKKDTEVTSTVKLPEAPQVDVSLGKAEVLIPEGKVEVQKPEVQIKPLHADVQVEGRGSRFKMPKFGIKMPKVKGPEFDLSFSKKDVDIKSPEAEFKLPEAPEVDVKLGKAEVLIPGVKMEVEKPELEMKPSETQVELDGEGSRFKMPKFGISMPKVKGPEFDLSFSNKDGDVTLPEAKVGVNLPKAPEVDVSLGSLDICVPEQKLKVDKPELEIKPLQTDQVELEGHGSRFKMPKFGISMPKVKGPEFDLSFSKKDGDINSPEAEFKLPEAPEVDVKLGKAEVLIPDVKMEIEKPELEMKPSETQVELEGHGSRFKMPKFGIKMPKVKGPEFDLSFSNKDGDVTLPEAKAEVSLPDVELKEPSAKVEVKAAAKDTSGSPSKFKMPSLSFSKPRVKVPDIDLNLSKKDTEVTSTVKLPEAPQVDVSLGKAEVLIPEGKVEVQKPEVQIKPLHADVQVEGRGSRFKMPKFGIKMPKVKGPEFDLSFSKKDGDINSPEAEFKLPEAPEVDVKLGKAGVLIPDVKMEVDKPELEMKPSETQVELDGEGSRFKMPKFGISMPKVKGPEFDLSFSNKDVDVTLPEAKAEVSLPDVELKEPSAKVEMKAPEIEAQLGSMKGSPSKLKLPTFKFPKFGATSSNVSAEVPDIEHKIKIDGAGVSVPDTEVEVKGAVSLPEVEVKEPSGGVVIEQPGVEVDAKMKKSKFSMPKFSFSKPSVKAPEVDVSAQNVDVAPPEVKVEVKGGEVDLKPPEVESDGQGSKFKMPKFGISMPKVTGPETDSSSSIKDVDVKIAEGRAEVKLPDVDLKEPSAEVEIKPPEIKVVGKDTEGLPSKFKMPTFKLPKFGIAAPSSSVEVPEMDKDVKINGGDIKIPKEGVAVNIAAPSIDAERPSIDLKTTATEGEGKGSTFKLPSLSFSVPQIKSPGVEVSSSKTGGGSTFPEAKVDFQLPDVQVKEPAAKGGIKAEGLSVNMEAKEGKVEGSESKFKMPHIGITVPKVKGPEIDLSFSKKSQDVTFPEGKLEVTLPSAEVTEPEGAISLPDAPPGETEAKSKRPNWTFPKFSFSRTSVKAPDVDVNLEAPQADVPSPEVEAEVGLPDVKVKEPSGILSVEEPPAAELDGNLKKSKFSLPKFSFSKSSVTTPEVSAEPPQVEVSLPEGEVRVKQPELEMKAPELEDQHKVQGSKFQFPKLGISRPKAEVDLSASQKAEVPLPKVTAGVKLPGVEVEESSAHVETDAKSKDVGGSPVKFKMPTFKMPKFGGAASDVAAEAPDADKAEEDGAKLEEDVKVEIKSPSVDLKTDCETPKTEADGHGSPSRFKLPSFKMPKLSFSKPKHEEEVGPGDDDNGQEHQPETEVETKSPKRTLTLFGEMLKNIDVEFDVSKTDEVEEHIEAPKDVQQTSDLSGKQLDTKEKETHSKQHTPKSPERTGWFKFPRFGLSSPSESAKTPEKEEDREAKSPETGDEEISPTCSVQSSDAFADISSTMTSEHVGPSTSSPTKVTVKYSDPDAAPSLEELHRNVITSTTRTQVISIEPNLPEKITILSSGVSSSSEDTLRLESGKTHVITTNIQATPDTQRAKLLTAVQVQSAGGPPLRSGGEEAASWAVEDSQGGKRTVFERHVVRETSSGRSESKETVVITKQITRIYDSSEPMLGETATSIQRLRDSVHSEKMRFFDGADK